MTTLFAYLSVGGQFQLCELYQLLRPLFPNNFLKIGSIVALYFNLISYMKKNFLEKEAVVHFTENRCGEPNLSTFGQRQVVIWNLPPDKAIC